MFWMSLGPHSDPNWIRIRGKIIRRTRILLKCLRFRNTRNTWMTTYYPQAKAFIVASGGGRLLRHQRARFRDPQEPFRRHIRPAGRVLLLLHRRRRGVLTGSRLEQCQRKIQEGEPEKGPDFMYLGEMPE